MLVLSRKLGEGILIGDDCYVQVVEINGNQIKLGVDAPAETEILREELVKFELTEAPRAPSAA